MRVRCPKCRHSFVTDRGVVVHTYRGSSDTEIRLAREALAAERAATPLPIVELPADAPRWLAERGIQESIALLADGMMMPEGDA